MFKQTLVIMSVQLMKSETREELFIRLYQLAFPKVAAFVAKSGGKLDDAKDIFQDALIIFYEKTTARETTFDNEVNYLNGIARHLWLKKFSNEVKNKVSLEKDLHIKQEEDEATVSERLLQYVEAKGKKCLDLLKSFYYDKLSMTEISQKFGFSGERSATVQKHKCIEKIRENIKKESLSKEDFYE